MSGTRNAGRILMGHLLENVYLKDRERGAWYYGDRFWESEVDGTFSGSCL